MKKYLFILFSIVLILSGLALAEEKGSKMHMHEDEELVTVIGEVIDISCYVAHGLKGAGHKDCAVACLEVGEPGGILEEETGKIYISVTEDHVTNPNEKLIPYAAKIVEAKGIVNEKTGIAVIDIKEIKEIEHKGSKTEEKGSKRERKGSGY